MHHLKSESVFTSKNMFQCFFALHIMRCVSTVHIPVGNARGRKAVMQYSTENNKIFTVNNLQNWPFLQQIFTLFTLGKKGRYLQLM
jgi:hypothetical protein